MFILTTIIDTVHVPAHMFALPTLKAIHQMIDLKFPNRVLMDVGLVICRHGSCSKITNGMCVPGEGGCHHECLFKLVIFRPFVEEVCVGTIIKSTPEGVQVSLGFFQDIFIPAYWMLNPSKYEEKNGLWVWTPNYDDDDDEEEEGGGGGGENEEGGEGAVKKEAADDPPAEANATGQKEVSPDAVMSEPMDGEEKKPSGGDDDDGKQQQEQKEEEEEEGERYYMNIGDQIRFKIKSIQFTQITNTAKGMHATTTTTSHSHSFPSAGGGDHHQDKKDPHQDRGQPIRKRSTSSVDISDVQRLPASMQIVASICEDGLGLTSWWESGGDEDEDDDEEVEVEEEEEEEAG